MEGFDWISPAAVRRFVRLADAVLNADCLLVRCHPATPIQELELADVIDRAIRAPDFGGRLELGREEIEPDDPAAWDYGTYSPPSQPAAVEAISIDEAREHLRAMLVASDPFWSPYHRALSPAEADAEAARFFEAFFPRPTLFARVDPAFLSSTTWLDGFSDQVLALATDSRLGLLLSNGTD